MWWPINMSDIDKWRTFTTFNRIYCCHCCAMPQNEFHFSCAFLLAKSGTNVARRNFRRNLFVAYNWWMTNLSLFHRSVNRTEIDDETTTNKLTLAIRSYLIEEKLFFPFHRVSTDTNVQSQQSVASSFEPFVYIFHDFENFRFTYCAIKWIPCHSIDHCTDDAVCCCRRRRYYYSHSQQISGAECTKHVCDSIYANRSNEQRTRDNIIIELTFETMNSFLLSIKFEGLLCWADEYAAHQLVWK